MNKKRIAIILVAVVLCVGAIGFVISKQYGNSGKQTSTTSTATQMELGNLKYQVKQEAKQDAVKKEDARVEKSFQVKDLQKVDDKLIVQTNAEIDNPEEAYKAALFLAGNIENLNKDKITSQGIKKVEIVIKGSKNWLYEGTGSIKEIEVK